MFKLHSICHLIHMHAEIHTRMQKIGLGCFSLQFWARLNRHGKPCRAAKKNALNSRQIFDVDTYKCIFSLSVYLFLSLPLSSFLLCFMVDAFIPGSFGVPWICNVILSRSLWGHSASSQPYCLRGDAGGQKLGFCLRVATIWTTYSFWKLPNSASAVTLKVWMRINVCVWLWGHHTGSCFFLSFFKKSLENQL